MKILTLLSSMVFQKKACNAPEPWQHSCFNYLKPCTQITVFLFLKALHCFYFLKHEYITCPKNSSSIHASFSFHLLPLQVLMMALGWTEDLIRLYK